MKVPEMNTLQLERRLRRLEETVGVKKKNLREAKVPLQWSFLRELNWKTCSIMEIKQGEHDREQDKGLMYYSERRRDTLYAGVNLYEGTWLFQVSSDDGGLDELVIETDSFEEALSYFKSYTGIISPRIFDL